jgi:hypothetical protein
MGGTEIARFRPKSYKILRPEARKTAMFQREINGMGVVQGELLELEEAVGGRVGDRAADPRQAVTTARQKPMITMWLCGTAITSAYQEQ